MTDEDEKKNTPDEDNDKGKKDDSTDSLFERTNKAAEKLEAANEKFEELLDRQASQYEKLKLGGRTSAGTVSKKSKEQLESDARVQAIGEAGGAQWAQPKKD